jgi:acyl carrier protein
MDINNFIKLFSEQFDETPSELFKPDAIFKDFEEWNSLTALSVIALVDEEFDKRITGADLRGSSTIEELFLLVQSK